MISVKIKGNFKKTETELKKIDDELKNGSFLQKLASLLNSSIQQRVQRFGTGEDGKKMSPYAKVYEAFKKSRGRQTGFRDLTFSGKMWQSLTSTKVGDDVKMFFGNAESANKAKGNEKKTPFFGLSAKEKAIIKRELNNLSKNI